MSLKNRVFHRLYLILAMLFALQVMVVPIVQPGLSMRNTPVVALLPRVNVPYLTNSPFGPAIFWLGKVDATSNYADVRLWYYDEYLAVMVNIIDRLVWYDPTPSDVELTNWDAVSLYIDLNGNSSASLSPNAFLFQSQHNYQAGYHWNGSAWVSASNLFTTETTWRGDGPNNTIDDEGWQVTFTIPFTSLGLSGPPAAGTKWGLAAVIHDRDDAAGAVFHNTFWPVLVQTNSPATWGQLNFGPDSYPTPRASPSGITTIRQGINGAQVIDAAVGGHTICGGDIDKWTQWGNLNYFGYDQMNIQNQWDIADWPCFSKYYLTFPLESLPSGKVIISAFLTMTVFGNAGGGGYGTPPDSFIQVFSFNQNWSENTLTWNNAPLALENISGTWVYPRNYNLPYESYQWDISKAVNDAYQAGDSLRLAVYSIDGERHSGKYFYTSDSNDWGGETRPTLRVVWGSACDSPGVVCKFIYLPLVRR